MSLHLADDNAPPTVRTPMVFDCPSCDGCGDVRCETCDGLGECDGHMADAETPRAWRDA